MASKHKWIGSQEELPNLHPVTTHLASGSLYLRSYIPPLCYTVPRARARARFDTRIKFKLIF